MRQNTEPVIDFQVRANKPPDHAGGKCGDGHARTGNSYWAAVYSFQWDLASADTNLTLNIRYPKNSTQSHNEIIKSLLEKLQRHLMADFHPHRLLNRRANEYARSDHGRCVSGLRLQNAYCVRLASGVDTSCIALELEFRPPKRRSGNRRARYCLPS